jgi:ribose transport system substrate-binding protein
MKWLRLLSLVCFGLLVASVPACKRDSGKTTVAFITNNSYDFWKIAERGTEKAAEEFNVEVDFRMPSGGGTSDEQRRIVEALLAKGVKGIAISPNDAENQTEFFKDKVSPHVPLITQDSDLPDTSARRCYIGTDNYKAGRAVGELVKKALPGGGTIAIFVGKLDVQNAVERRQGVLDELAGRKRDKFDLDKIDPKDAQDLKLGKYTLLETVTDNGSRDACQRKAAAVLSKPGGVDCMIGLWEYNPPAILKAVLNPQVKKKPVIIGFDENDETLEGIKQGQVAATVVQDPYQFGYQAIKILAGLARGDESVLKNRKDIDDKGRIFVPHRVITKENVDKFHAELNKLKGK